ncbi:MAG: response regulator [Desulfobacteraceae bacterium]|nr:MAG: response regulator [Desulfobacteraceae bacterium]
MIFEDDETLQMYIEESLDHLSNIENDLLLIEEAGADINEELVNNVFRAAHSIKGGAGFMGLSNIKELSHKIENVLGLIRSREIVPTPETINTLLKAFDTLKDMIHDVEHSNGMDTSEHIVALVGLTAASLPDDEKESVAGILNISIEGKANLLTAPQFDIDQAKKEGMTIYLVEYDLIHDIHRKKKTPLDVISSLINSGKMIQSKIDIDAVGTLNQEIPTRIPFYILFASIIEPEIITALFDVEEKYVHVVTESMCSPAHEGALPEPDLFDILSEESPETPDIPEPESIPFDEPIESAQTIEPVSIPDPVKEDTAETISTLSKPATSQTSLRVNVDLLDDLMTLAGELVLSRNQLLQGISLKDKRTLEIAGQRIDMVTSELQEAIMKTRMQSISNVFNKFPRVVRDLARDLGKEIALSIEGKDVELDKTIIEAISDPLTHLVRNAVDHGIESPEVRRSLGKDPTGIIKLKAFHEAGQVNIEITDDGKGIDGNQLVTSALKKNLINDQEANLLSDKEKIALIFLPGFSTAHQVTDISGRGVGMDVVKTNLDKLGGIVDIESAVHKGTVIRIKLPLTLAIIPSQIISVGNERYAIPQVNLNELLRIPAVQVKDRIEKVGNAEVVRLRGSLLPLLNLSKVLEIDNFYVHPSDGSKSSDRRENIADRRSKYSPPIDPPESELPETQPDTPDETGYTPRQIAERRRSINSAINIAVVSAGPFKYGLVVNYLRDSEEIVVKPLGRHLKGCQGYAGATIMGDGKVALILDVAGLAQMAKLASIEKLDSAGRMPEDPTQAQQDKGDATSLLLFRNGIDEQCAVPLAMVERIERIKVANIETVGGKKVIQYRGGSLPLFSLDQVADMKSLPESSQLEVIVFTLAGREVGLMVTPPVDAVDVVVELDKTTLRQTGIMGSAIIGNHTTLMVDMYELVRAINPGWFEGKANRLKPSNQHPLVLFAEDSDFFRNQVKGFLEDAGYRVLEAKDGLAAWDLLEQNADSVSIILTDLEMPGMDGFELAAKIKGDERFSHLKIIALTSLADDEDIEKGTRIGIDDYQIKLDREKLIEAVKLRLGK